MNAVIQTMNQLLQSPATLYQLLNFLYAIPVLSTEMMDPNHLLPFECMEFRLQRDDTPDKLNNYH